MRVAATAPVPQLTDNFPSTFPIQTPNFPIVSSTR